jgi:hypothetical protein
MDEILLDTLEITIITNLVLNRSAIITAQNLYGKAIKVMRCAQNQRDIKLSIIKK